MLVLCAGCAPVRPRSGSPIDPALLMLTPGDTTSLLWVKMEKLVKTPGFSHFAKSGLLRDALDLLASQTSYDPRKDFWEVLIISSGTGAVLLARGQLAPLGMEPEFKKEGSKRIGYRGQTLISTGGVVLAFMSPSCLAVGSLQSVEHLVDARVEQRVGPPAALLERANQIDRKNQVWWVSTAPAALIPKQVPAAAGGLSNILANLPRLLYGVRTIAGAMDLSAGIGASFDAEFAASAQARDSASALGAFFGLAKATIPQSRPRQHAFYDSIKVERRDITVHISVDAPMAILPQALP